VILARGTDGEKIQLQRTLEKHAVLHLMVRDGMIRETEKLTLISGVRASGTHAGVLMIRSQKVFVKNGVTQEKMVIYIWIKVCLMEGDHIRPWRPSYARGRVEPGHSQSTTPNKQASTFSYGRGRGENTPPPVFSPGHGRGGSSLNSTYTGTALDRVESGHEEPYPFRYNRTKLLDVYRVTNMSRNRKLDDFVQVPNLTQDEPLEPLALMTPSSEELVRSLFVCIILDCHHFSCCLIYWFSV
jgi:hypothetical protein